MLEEEAEGDVNAAAATLFRRFDFFSNDTTWQQEEFANLSSYGDPPRSDLASSNRTSAYAVASAASHWLFVTRFVCEVCISFPIAVAGILGNAMTVFVLFHYKPAMSTTVILRWLAVNNSLSLTASIFLRSLRYADLAPYAAVFRYIFFWMFPTNFAIRLTDTWLVVLLTFDRYVAVCYPFQASRLCSRTKTNVAVFVIVVSAYLFSAPRYFEYIELNSPTTTVNHKASKTRQFTLGFVPILKYKALL